MRFDDYEIIAPIGKGGMGVVYLAEDIRLKRKVALKLLPHEFTADPVRLRRFEQEAQATSALNHPNIITIHEIGTFNSTHYISTEFIQGETLRDHLGREKIGQLKGIDIVIQAGNALAAAHAAGIIHRDVKPENIMVRPDGYVKVLDFGIAKLSEKAPIGDVDTEAETLLHSSTHPGMVMGTASYMSPEQARGERVDMRTDIFSLGVILYEAVTGFRPFSGASPIETMAAVLQADPEPIAKYVSSAPYELQRILNKALRKKRDERYQNINDFLLDLQSLKRDLEMGSNLLPAKSFSSSHNMSSAEYLIGEMRRHKRGVMLAVAAFVVLAVAASLLVSRSDKLGSIAIVPMAAGEGDGLEISDLITTELVSKFRDYSMVSVSAHSKVVEAKSRFQNDVQALAKELAVESLLTCEIRSDKSGRIIRLELSDAQTRRHLWGKDYQWSSAQWEVLPLQIMQDVFNIVAVPVEDEQKRKLEAALAYAVGRTAWRERTVGGMQRARKSFEEAISKWPDYALAYAGLADCYNMMVAYSVINPEEGLPKSQENADKAISLNPQLAEGHAAKAYYWYQKWEWDRAEDEFLQAINRDDKYGPGHQWYSNLLAIKRNWDEAQRRAERAKELEPHSAIVSSHLSWVSFLARDYKNALAVAQETLKREPNSYIGHRYSGLAYLGQAMNGAPDKFEQSIQELKISLDRSRGSILLQADLGYAFAVKGERTEAENLLQQIEAAGTSNPYYMALIHTGLGNKDKAFELLFKGCEKKAERIPYVLTDPRFDSLQTDARFSELQKLISEG